MHKLVGWVLIALGLAALGAFFVLAPLPPLVWGLFILAGSWFVFGKLHTHGAKAKIGLVLLILGIAALGSFFFIVSLPPLGYGVLVLAGGYLASSHSGRRR